MTDAKTLAERLRHWTSWFVGPDGQMKTPCEAADLIERQNAELAALRAELEVAESALLRKGYRKTCDIAACNCGSQWNHGGNAEQRLSEIGEALRGAGFNGGTLLGNIETVCAERDALKAEPAALPAEVDALLDQLGAVAEAHSDRLRWLIDDDDPRRPIGRARLFLENDVRKLLALGEMLAAVVQGAKEEFVRVPYGASHEDVAAINDWHKMAAEALAAWENKT